MGTQFKRHERREFTEYSMLRRTLAPFSSFYRAQNARPGQVLLPLLYVVTTKRFEQMFLVRYFEAGGSAEVVTFYVTQWKSSVHNLLLLVAQ